MPVCQVPPCDPRDPRHLFFCAFLRNQCDESTTDASQDLLPAVLAAVRHPEDEVAMAVVPFLVSWVARLKSTQKRTGGVPAVSLCTVRV